MELLVITERLTEHAVILDLCGDLVFGEPTDLLRRQLRQCLADGRTKIYLNLKSVNYLDSAGIGELVSALIAINREQGGQLRILNPAEKARRVLEISNMDTVFDIDFDEDRAAGG